MLQNWQVEFAILLVKWDRLGKSESEKLILIIQPVYILPTSPWHIDPCGICTTASLNRSSPSIPNTCTADCLTASMECKWDWGKDFQQLVTWSHGWGTCKNDLHSHSRLVWPLACLLALCAVIISMTAPTRQYSQLANTAMLIFNSCYQSLTRLLNSLFPLL